MLLLRSTGVPTLKKCTKDGLLNEIKNNFIEKIDFTTKMEDEVEKNHIAEESNDDSDIEYDSKGNRIE